MIGRLGILLALTLLVQTGSQAQTAPSHKVTACVSTQRSGFLNHHSDFLYQVEGRDEPVLLPGKRLKSVPDRRSYYDKFPVRSWVQGFSRRWGATIGVVLGVLVTSSGGRL